MVGRSTTQRRAAVPGFGGRGAESLIQRAVVQRLALSARPGVVWFHPANGGARSKVEAARFKAEGVVAGVPDLILIRGGYVYALELKTQQGRLSPAQKTMHARLIEAGAMVATAHDVDEAIAQLEAWELLK